MRKKLPVLGCISFNTMNANLLRWRRRSENTSKGLMQIQFHRKSAKKLNSLFRFVRTRTEAAKTSLQSQCSVHFAHRRYRKTRKINAQFCVLKIEWQFICTAINDSWSFLFYRWQNLVAGFSESKLLFLHY